MGWLDWKVFSSQPFLLGRESSNPTYYMCRNQLTPHPYGSFDKLIKHFLKINYYNSHKIPIQIFKFVKNNSQIPKLFKLKVKK